MNNKILSVAIAATMIFTGCNNDNDPITDHLVDTPIKVTAGVNDIVARAGHDNTNKPTQLGVFVENAANGTYTYKNIEMNSADAGATWTPETMMLWENSNQLVSVLAYVPFSSTLETELTDARVLTAQTIQTDQSSAANVKTSDYLHHQATSVTPNVEGISIPFTHALSKLNLTITLGTEFNNQDGTQVNPIADVKINGTKTSFDWDLTTNKTSLIVATSTPIIPFVGEYTPGVGIDATATNAKGNYEAILVPQTVAVNGFSIEFKVNGKSYYWASPNAVTLTQNTAYTLALTVGKDIVTAGDFDITDWVNGTGGNIETE
jgi:hypothetical protein